MVRNVAIYARVSTEHEAQLSALENQIQYYDNDRLNDIKESANECEKDIDEYRIKSVAM